MGGGGAVRRPRNVGPEGEGSARGEEGREEWSTRGEPRQQLRANLTFHVLCGVALRYQQLLHLAAEGHVQKARGAGGAVHGGLASVAVALRRAVVVHVEVRGSEGRVASEKHRHVRLSCKQYGRR